MGMFDYLRSSYDLGESFTNLQCHTKDIEDGIGGTMTQYWLSPDGQLYWIDSLPPHNVIVEDHPEISHDGLAFSPGETIEVTFPESGDFNFWCEPHKGAGMTGVVHVN